MQQILDSVSQRGVSAEAEAEVTVARFLLQNKAVQTTIQQALAADPVVHYVDSESCYFAVPAAAPDAGTSLLRQCDLGRARG